ncbi:hypothetical protein EK21DRAFT_96307 [Setomelanomma holmii]|uniref:Uncharacterized protein n=1 Tax=Setomelanomma holmii TaxID=210430 RepID=A0A9P4HND2_9PLEO|nr:hypothetical protein EK21DRAFT_96307 [Setomelanomma holmii]
MSRVILQLTRQQSKLFKVSYAPDYKTFLPKFIISDSSHPLNETQKRRAKERGKEGLWWHTTTGVDLSKSSCVRGWARRRLRTAVVEELKARGYDENGKVAHVGSLTSSSNVPNATLFDLKGSLRLHAQAPLVPAKFVDVRADVSKILDIMVEAAKVQPNDQVHGQPTKPRVQRNPPMHMQSKRIAIPSNRMPRGSNGHQMAKT